MRRIALLLSVLTILGTFALAQPPRAQRPRPGAEGDAAEAPPALPRSLRPRVFAVRDAKVITAPGQVLAKATIVVRNGVIESVGENVAVPGDALLIDGQGKTVFPGFIDAMSSWGFDPALRRSVAGPASAEDLASEPLIATKPDNRKGVTPEFSVATALKMEEEAADQWRRSGVTAHVVAPEGGIVVGQSAIVSLSGATPREALLRPIFAMHMAFRSPPGSEYPRVLMGVIAHARQLLLDAQHYQRMQSANNGPAQRASFDPALEALQTAIGKKLPMVIEADTRDEIHRALDFAEEFGLQSIIWGGRQAWKVVDRLKATNTPIILRTNLTEVNEDRERDLPQWARLERNRQRHEERLNPQKLQAAGVDFSFGSMGLTEGPAGKFLGTLRTLVDLGLPRDAALTALTITPAKQLGLTSSLGNIAPGKLAHFVLADGDPFDSKTKFQKIFVDGVNFELDSGDADKPSERPGRGNRDREDAKAKAPPLPDTFIGPPSWLDIQVETDANRAPTLKTNGSVLIRGANVITVSSGTMNDTDVLVQAGKIAAIGHNLAPMGSGVAVIEAKGLYLMPGIIDTHSHFAASGGLNESSLSVVPEVRVKDVIDGDDVQIFRALAGGVTTARILHGSANCIGGQDAVLKMKYGRPARELIIPEGPQGVKFALGENVKRTDGRFPNTRLGVEAVLIRAFTEAQEYQRGWDEYRKAKEAGKAVVEPRRDLRLEALAEMLKGNIKIHCHCYRADEILMLLRVADRFGIKIQSLQHVLEGYKIGPEIAAHGALVSLFSDWWAYKIEAFDAIPFAAALLHAAGATVCLKSDSNELMRHLYQEAAKCVKYGGMSEDDAIRSITLNCAKQLGLEKRLGSIEVGKDADLVLFNGHPLNSFSRVELTLVEGDVFFQRDAQLKPEPLASVGLTTAAMALKLPEQVPTFYSLTGVTVHPVTGPAVKNTTIVVRDGKIVSIGPSDVKVQRIPADGLHVYPGMIDAGTVLGLVELESARETQDSREGGDFQPDLRASVAVNPDSELIPVTRANGVLTVVTRPTGGIIAGQSALINLAGWVPREMAVIDPLALHIELPSGLPFFAFFDPSVTPMGRNLAKKQRDERIRRLKDLFRQAIAYEAGRKQSPSATPLNTRLEALVPYAKGEKPVIVEAQRKPELLEALKLADELKLKIILCGAVDAWKIAPELKEKDIPVIYGPTMTMPQERDDPFHAPFSAPALLHKAGVRFCIRSEGGSNARNLPYQAAMAVSYGLPVEEGLKAVTLYPAQILGIADQLGSLEIGKRANLVITNGDLLQATTQVLAVAIDGKLMPPESKQTRLYDRYKQRLKEVKEGKAMLGTK